MKYTILILALAGCIAGHNHLTDGVKNFIPGMYARTVWNEASIGKDSLLIKTGNGVTYTILHTGSYQRILDGKLLHPEHKQEGWMGIYDEKQQVVVEQKRGRILSFQPDSNTLMVGSSVYKKISSF